MFWLFLEYAVQVDSPPRLLQVRKSGILWNNSWAKWERHCPGYGKPLVTMGKTINQSM